MERPSHADKDDAPAGFPEQWVIVALGANLGNAADNVRRGFERLEELAEKHILRSSVWETTPVNCPPESPKFANAVAAWMPHPEETPETFLTRLQELEKEFGRKPKLVLNEARTLDLDLITFGQEIRITTRLILPHPRAHLRRFVLQPLAEIASGLVLPGQQKSVGELLASLPEDPAIKRLS